MSICSPISSLLFPVVTNDFGDCGDLPPDFPYLPIAEFDQSADLAQYDFHALSRFDHVSPASTWSSLDESTDGLQTASGLRNDQILQPCLPIIHHSSFLESTVSEAPLYGSVDPAPFSELSLDEGSRRNPKAPWAWGENRDSDSGMYDCPQCRESFEKVFELEEHAKRSNHKPFLCHQCDQTFSRRDAWTRHKQLHQSRGRHPCPRCDKYSGKNAFKRRDHLKKHLMTVHQDTDHPSLCSVDTCPFSTPHGSFKQFDRRKDYTKHMRENHGRETYDCNMGDCRRVGSRGFARKHDLVKHLAKEHRATDDENAVELRLRS